MSEQKAFVEICISVTANVSKLKACVRPHVNVRPEPSFPFSRALFFVLKRNKHTHLGLLPELKTIVKIRSLAPEMPQLIFDGQLSCIFCSE